MLYTELLRHLRHHQIEELGRLATHNDTAAILGNPRDACFPFYPKTQLHRIYVQGDDWDLDEEEVFAICRRFKIEKLHEDG